MTVLDHTIFALYMAGVLAVGFYHFRRNSNLDDYYVGSRDMSWSHVGMSVVATDVGGGFSIGLGGLGFAMGLAGSWLLFTGLVGAWLTAVVLIPRVKRLDQDLSMFTYPDLLRWRYGEKTALLAAAISGIGYLGFTGVLLGMTARVLFPEVEAEMGLPLLIAEVLPAGIAGLVIAAYFSAIMSTADSCLMAASGNLVGDFISRLLPWAGSPRA